jgi:putative hydrolase of the HAD superfamily
MAAVWFDLDGTLVRFARPYGELIGEALDRHGLSRTGGRVRAYDETFYRAFEAHEPEPVRVGMAAVVEAAGDGTGDPPADPGALARTLREVEYAATEPAPDAAAALAALADDGHAVGVLTNGLPAWQRGKLAAVGLADRVDAVVASYEAGAHKPEPAPFDLARERLSAGTHWMVGDDREADVAGARSAGFRAIHVDRGGGAATGAETDGDGDDPGDGTGAPVPRVGSLASVAPLVAPDP